MDSLGRSDGMRPLIADVGNGALVEVTWRCTVAFQASNCRETVIERAKKELTPSAKCLPLTPTHGPYQGEIAGYWVNAARICDAVACCSSPGCRESRCWIRRTGPFDRKKRCEVLPGARVFVVIDWLASTGKFCVTA